MSAPYRLKEIYLTLQGEGYWAGRCAVFLRFSGCNLGYKVCPFCDTDWVGTDGEGGGVFETADHLVRVARRLWPGSEKKFAVLTGGEPLLQLDDELSKALRADFFVAVETNGSVPLKAEVDWVTVSPKQGPERLVVTSGDELKLLYPLPGLEPERFKDLRFSHRWLQPLDDRKRVENAAAAVRYCLEHPEWRLSLQTHKLVGIP